MALCALCNPVSGHPPSVLTKAEKQEQEAAVGGGPPGSQAGWSSLQGHGLQKTGALMSPPLSHHCVPPATLPQASAEGSLGFQGSDLHRPPGHLCGHPAQHQPVPALPIWEAGPTFGVRVSQPGPQP